MTKVDELRRVIVGLVADSMFDQEMDAHRKQITLEQCRIDAGADVDLLISAAHAEGVEEERWRIRQAATPIDDSLHQKMSLAVPYSVLAPKEKP
jgi:hypothetical protein